MKSLQEIQRKIDFFQRERDYWREEARRKDTAEGYSEYAWAIAAEHNGSMTALEWVISDKS